MIKAVKLNKQRTLDYFSIDKIAKILYLIIFKTIELIN